MNEHLAVEHELVRAVEPGRTAVPAGAGDV
jgi:hypothetical protein